MSGKQTGNPYFDAIAHGDDLNDWYTQNTKDMKAEADLAGYEIGERTRFHANNFKGNVPEIGSGTDLYEKYANLLDA